LASATTPARLVDRPAQLRGSLVFTEFSGLGDVLAARRTHGHKQLSAASKVMEPRCSHPRQQQIFDYELR
jgi:hypothetical protein